MATNITEALQGAGAVSAKPVTMEAIPEATIDVGGGSQSLEIEGLGVKRRKDDLSVTTASTSGIAVEDLFGDLLDEVNFSDPSSVDAFKEAAASRINEFDSSTFSSILGEASTVAGDLATFASQFQGSSQPQQQFEQVFGPPSVTSGDDAGDIGLDTATSTEAEDLSSLSNPGLAAGLVGGTFSALGPGAGFSGLGTSIAASAIGQTDVVGALGGFSAAQSLANAEITDLASALSAASAALAVGQTSANVVDLVNSNATVTDLFDRATKNVEEFIGDIVSAVSNPEQAISAFGLEMAYGTTTPDLYSFDFPGGRMSFAFDAKTGAVAVPGAISAMMGRSPLGAFYDIAQTGLEKFGYTDAMADRNLSAINAFSMPGVQFDQMSVHSSSVDALTGVNPETGAASTVGAFGALDMSQAGFGTVGFDLGAVADAIGAGTIGDLSFSDFQDVAISGHLGHGPMGFDAFNEEEALAQDIAAGFSNAGLDTAADIAAAAERASQATAAFAAELSAFTGYDITSLDVADVAGRAGALSASQAAAIKDLTQTDPITALAARISAYEKGYDFGVMTQPAAMKSALEAIQGHIDSSTEGLGQSFAEDYNSPNPSPNTVDMANKLGITSISTNTKQDLATKAAVEALAQQQAYDSLGLGVAFSAMTDFGFESLTDAYSATQNEPLGEMDVNFSTGSMGSLGAKSDPSSAYGEMPDYHSPEFDPADFGPGGDAGKGGAGAGKGYGGFDADAAGWDGSDGDDGDDGDGSDGDTYICTAAYANGVTDYSTFSANRKYGIRLRRNDPYLMKGYDLVGPTYAKWFGNNGVGKTLTNYYKKSVMGEQLSWKYKLLEKFLLYINRPTLRTLGYIHERISGKG